jgi:hypothetical protein
LLVLYKKLTILRAVRITAIIPRLHRGDRISTILPSTIRFNILKEIKPTIEA